MTGRPNPIGAYVVTSPDEEHSVIVYARNPMEARRIGACEVDSFGGGDECYCGVERRPELDEGYDTRMLLELGWHFECGGCYNRCTEDSEHLVVRDDVAYCSAECCIRELKRQREERAAIWRGLELITELAPGARIERLYLNVAGEVVAEVHRPGAEHSTVELFERSEHEGASAG